MVRFSPFNERRVQCRRVLGVVEHFFEPPRRSHQLSSFDLHDTIVSSRLEHLAVQSRWTKDATDDLLVEIESVGDDQGKTLEIHPVRDVAQQSERVSVASSSGHCRWPKPRPNLDRDEYPRWPRLAAGEGANFVGLELLDGESGSPSLVEATANVGGFLKPSSDGVPGKPFDASNRRDADALDSESDHCVESRPSMLETVVRRAFRRRERLFALDAPVATAFRGSRPVESVPNDVPGADFFMRTTFGVETAQTFHSRGPCRRKNYVRRNQAQTLARRLVRAWPPTLDCGSTINSVKGWIGVLMTEDSSLPWRTKRRCVYPKRPG